MPIQVNNPDVVLSLVYIDDVVNELINALEGKVNTKEDGYSYVQTVHTVKLGEIAGLINSFRASREERSIPDMSNSFVKKLYRFQCRK